MYHVNSVNCAMRLHYAGYLMLDIGFFNRTSFFHFCFLPFNHLPILARLYQKLFTGPAVNNPLILWRKAGPWMILRNASERLARNLESSTTDTRLEYSLEAEADERIG